MPRDYRLYLDDILGAIERIREYTERMDEAARNVPEALQDQAGAIEWRKIMGLRNILAHEYFGVSMPIIWDIVRNKLGPLEEACKGLLKPL